MSLIDRFSARTLRVGLAPGGLTSVERRGNSYVIESAFRQELDNPEGHWQPVLNLLASRLREESGAKAAQDFSVVLSSKWCRTMMVPWSDAMLKEGSAKHFLEAQFVALYGDDARNWEITVDDVAYGRPRLACAIERDLLQSLHQIAADSKRRCCSVEPVLSAAWRAVNKTASSEIKAFAVVEDGRSTIACATQGCVNAVQSQSCGQTWIDELLHEWQRWTLRLPAITDINEVAVLNLRRDAATTGLPKPFKNVLMPSYGLDPAYRFVTCGGLV